MAIFPWNFYFYETFLCATWFWCTLYNIFRMYYSSLSLNHHLVRPLKKKLKKELFCCCSQFTEMMEVKFAVQIIEKRLYLLQLTRDWKNTSFHGFFFHEIEQSGDWITFYQFVVNENPFCFVHFYIDTSIHLPTILMRMINSHKITNFVKNENKSWKTCK